MSETHFQLLEQWLQQRTLQNQSPHTIDAYRRDIHEFLHYIANKNLALAQLTRSDIQDYIVYNIEQKQLQNKSLQRHLSAIRQFMQWLKTHHILENTPTDDIKIKNQAKRLPGLLDESLIQQLLDQEAPSDNKEYILWIRDKAILELFYSSGLRLSELQALTLKDIDFKRDLIRVLGKGNKQRIVPMGSKAKASLNHWLHLYQQMYPQHLNPNAPLFMNAQGKAISHRQIENRVKYQALRAGIAINLHPHLLRHSFASHLLARSGQLRAVQEFLGHENLATTQIYTHLDFQQLQQEYRDRHPRARNI